MIYNAFRKGCITNKSKVRRHQDVIKSHELTKDDSTMMDRKYMDKHNIKIRTETNQEVTRTTNPYITQGTEIK